MRRTPIVLTATLAGLAGVLGFHSQSQGPLAGTSPAAGPNAATGAAQLGSAQQTRQDAGPVTVDGSAIPNPYGVVQVQITADSGRITDVATLQIPQGDSTSTRINTVAGPQLQQQALAAQSAQIDGVSGASYTSAGYQQSLQAAIDQLPAESGLTA